MLSARPIFSFDCLDNFFCSYTSIVGPLLVLEKTPILCKPFFPCPRNLPTSVVEDNVARDAIRMDHWQRRLPPSFSSGSHLQSSIRRGPDLYWTLLPARAGDVHEPSIRPFQCHGPARRNRPPRPQLVSSTSDRRVLASLQEIGSATGLYSIESGEQISATNVSAKMWLPFVSSIPCVDDSVYV